MELGELYVHIDYYALNNIYIYKFMYDKRDDFNFNITYIPLLSSNIPSSPAYGVFISQPIRYTVACASYECIILRAWRLKLNYLNRETSWNASNRHSGSFMVDTGILFSNNKVSILTLSLNIFLIYNIYYLCCLCIDLYDLSAWCGCWFLSIYRGVFTYFKMCVILITRLLRGVGRWTRKLGNHASWLAVVTPTDRPKSARNRCVIELG